MKKSILLLVFVACTLMASAMNGPVKSFDPQKLAAATETATPGPKAACLLCSDCKGVTVCFIASNCDKAGSALAILMQDLGCFDDH